MNKSTLVPFGFHPPPSAVGAQLSVPPSCFGQKANGISCRGPPAAVAFGIISVCGMWPFRMHGHSTRHRAISTPITILLLPYLLTCIPSIHYMFSSFLTLVLGFKTPFPTNQKNSRT